MGAAFGRQREIALVLVVAFREIARKSDVFAQHPEGERAGRGIGFDDADAVVRPCLAHAAREHPATEAGVRDKLPDAELVFTRYLMHELLSVHSEEELDCIRPAGVLCTLAIDRKSVAEGKSVQVRVDIGGGLL